MIVANWLIYVLVATTLFSDPAKMSKEKFITSDRSGNPRYFVITDSGSYCLSPDEYASLDTGEVYYEKDFYLVH